MQYFVVDVETIPIDYTAYQLATEEERKKYFNPIDSKIIAIGLRYNDDNMIFLDHDEKKIIDAFWEQWDEIKGFDTPSFYVVGFNILEFDLTLLVGRSFFNNIPIEPFTYREIIDLRQNLAALKYNPRGTLKEYASLIGLELSQFDGSMISELVASNRLDEVEKYLKKDLEITDAVFKRAEKLNILKISRWG
jgi:hypothetical protein